MTDILVIQVKEHDLSRKRKASYDAGNEWCKRQCTGPSCAGMFHNFVSVLVATNGAATTKKLLVKATDDVDSIETGLSAFM